jgi:hypothetical protein
MYPESVLTRNRKGENEVRNLLSSGRFVEYNYTDPSTGKVMEGGKRSIILDDGKKRHYFIIPLKDGRFLLVEDRDKKKRMLWDGRKPIEI